MKNQSESPLSSGRQYWRSLEELAGSHGFKALLPGEFSRGAGDWVPGLSRRNFLKIAAASLALAGGASCTKQAPKEIVPYVNQPVELIPGEPLYYATAMTLGGFATGIIAKNREGHPIKIEGNPDHPSSLGGSSIWMQASILDLYDPDRSKTVLHHGEISTWALFLSDLNQLLSEPGARQGAGWRFLTETITSPTLAWQLADLLNKYPGARWHQYEPIGRDHVKAGARLAFGEFVETHYHFEQAAIVLSLGADFLHAHPDRLRYTRQFTNGRRVGAGQGSMNRLYVAESSPSLTGSMAEHRLPVTGAGIEELAVAIAGQIGMRIPPGHSDLSRLAPAARQWLEAAARDLQAHRGGCAVLAGESQGPLVHALVHAMNEHLGNVGKTISYRRSAEASPVDQLKSLQTLVEEIGAGAVDTLVILGGNPVYSAPSDLEFASALKKVRRTIHLGMEQDETAALCTWHIPQAHYLESWGDARAFDGTVTIQQPLIAPLYNGKTAHELLGAFFQQQPVPGAYELLRQYWQHQKLWPEFDQGWRRALHDGLIRGTEASTHSPRARLSAIQAALANARREDQGPINGTSKGPERSGEILELQFLPEPSLWDGRFANNAWLQECPRFLSKITWDNAALISPALAQRRGLGTGDVIELRNRGTSVRAPVWIMPGQAANTITVHLGYGRERVGRVGAGLGFNAYKLRTSAAPWFASGLDLGKANSRHLFATTQNHHLIDSEDRQVYRAGTFEEFLAKPDFIKARSEAPGREETLYNPDEYASTLNQWGMSIDLTTCIGCNACLVACEVENNIPAVGKEQVRRHREMFWIRVDTYFEGERDNPRFHHMPVPCMHCEHAPCELVCPVAATVHDHEGLNLQVYNRCVGTRFCSNNCPYKVRRFNFFQYTDYQQPSFKPMYNPDVTVRWRGVMEKCTYCIQRISRARIQAEKENRAIGDGEIQTACQQACPAEAIVFGSLSDPNSRVAARKRSPLDYPMLGQLNTRPRTTYLAKLNHFNANLPRV